MKSPSDPDVDHDNIHTAIAIGIAEDLRGTYPNIHFQVLAPGKDARLPGSLTPFSHAIVSFTFVMAREGHSRPLHHSGVIKIDKGVGLLRVNNPTNHAERYKLDSPQRYYIYEEFPLETPEFPQILYDRLNGTLCRSINPPRDKTNNGIVVFPYEVVLGGKSTVRHLTWDRYTSDMTTFCGMKLPHGSVKTIRQCEDFVRDGRYCANCANSRQFNCGESDAHIRRNHRT